MMSLVFGENFCFMVFNNLIKNHWNRWWSCRVTVLIWHGMAKYTRRLDRMCQCILLPLNWRVIFLPVLGYYSLVLFFCTILGYQWHINAPWIHQFDWWQYLFLLLMNISDGEMEVVCCEGRLGSGYVPWGLFRVSIRFSVVVCKINRCLNWSQEVRWTQEAQEIAVVNFAAVFFMALVMPSHASATRLWSLSRVKCVASCNVILSSLQSSLILSIHHFFGRLLFLTSWT